MLKTNILFIGDSHTVQSFGLTLHAKLFHTKGIQIATFASCGSKPKDWLSHSPYAITECSYFHGFINGEAVKGLKGKTPYFPDLLKNMNVRTDKVVVPNVVIIALGANIVDAILENQNQYMAKSSIKKMIELTKKAQAQCIWIAPPSGTLFSHFREKQDLLYRLLEEANSECQNYAHILSSKAKDHPFLTYPKGCDYDGVHFDQCIEGRLKAIFWAESKYDEIISFLKTK